MTTPTVSFNTNSIVKMELEILNAMQQCDTEKLDKLLHDQLLFTIPNEQTIDKKTDLEVYQSGNMNISKMSASEQQINLIDDTAIVSVVIDMEGSYFNHSLNGKYKVLRVWKYYNNQWQVIAGSSNTIL
ncbi:nuclear transport factor 2 family protein [Tenacibaculum sp. 190524A02b]|uniref:Nuclear transport factor 2 family protein n=1 Tax=Tenacibaculum vairaonense TaxID=3137860 RepID=A0ABP1F8P9_9FLAO